MKKVVVVLLAFLLVFQVSALQTTFKENYQPGQTLIAEISGNVIDNIKASDLTFFSDRDFIPLDYNVGKLGNKYYVYAVLPMIERNYTLTIRNLHYTELGQEKYQNLQFNFSVSGNASLFSITPGFVITGDNFTLDVTSNIRDISVKADFQGESQTKDIREAKSVSFKFSPETSNSSFFDLIISSGETSYTVPAYILKKTKPINISLPVSSLNFSQRVLNLTVIQNQEFEFSVSLLNNGQGDLKNITISSDLGFIKIIPNNLSLASEDLAFISLLITSKELGIASGKLGAKNGSLEDSINIYLNTVKDIDAFKNATQNTTANTTKTCSQLGGNFCEMSQSCDGKMLISSDYDTQEKPCCVGVCQALSSSTSSGAGKWVALAIIILILVGGGYFLYKKASLRRGDAKDFFKQKEKEFADRFNPKSEEVNDKLSKI